MATADNNDARKVVIGPVRFSFLNIWEPRAIGDSPDKKYSVSLIIPKKDKAMIAKIEKAITAAKELGKTGKSKWKGKIPTGEKMNPLKDSEDKHSDDEAYADSMCVSANASENKQPGVVDAKRNVIVDQSEMYSGCYGYASVQFFPYDTGSNGIGCALLNLMKTKDGEPLGGTRESAEDAFAGITVAADEDEDL